MAIRAVIIVATAGLVLNAGCASKALRVGPHPAPAATVGESVEESGCGVLIFDLIPIGINDRTDRAHRHAVGSGSGLTDTQIKTSWYYLPLVGTILCTTLKGKVVR